MAQVIIKNASKNFKIGRVRQQGLFATVIATLSGKEPKKKICGFKNVSLEANPGDFIGIIGSNGSGKTSLLRAVAGIYNTDEGTIHTQGKTIPLINLNSGLKERLSARDNIYLYGALYGLSRKTIKERFSAIIDFSGLKEFVDTKVYQYSSGMKQRLIFSVVLHTEPDVLLLDEDFGMGDEDYVSKSFEALVALANRGAIIFLISHNLDLIRKRCNRVIWMEKGRLMMEGNASDVIQAYLNRKQGV